MTKYRYKSIRAMLWTMCNANTNLNPVRLAWQTDRGNFEQFAFMFDIEGSDLLLEIW